ncbi:hypothetical protein UA08_03660 [Talaromyces atroroseus]|uniref:Protein-S-isoprenylcysteine O-methyltransferase n=1 Tax=Talaromyces atroroseus TaxID=1441469 RepID=A0A225B6H8_TALAT|nr:hypothetical protein UA08_03660 [Talaromyces atroroseus]OKL61507.1 hypothetical protein UA08_03660 [Talaromyces atroroseus]
MSTGIPPPSFSSSPLESTDAGQRWEGEYMAWRPPGANANTSSANSNGSTAPPDIVNSAGASPHPSVLPNGKMSLAGISIRAFFLGVVLGISLIATIILLVWHPTPLWRLPFFISSLCLFHFLEFWVTAQYNTRDAEVSAFLLTANGAAYNIAHGSAMLECFIWHFLLAPKEGAGGGSWYSAIIVFFGLAAMIVGQIVRTVAMATAGSNFNHVVQARYREGHVLVTGGVYSLLRHPSYFGFFWWGLGSQLVMQNVVCFIGSRIQREERFLVAFFGDDYISYKSRTPVGIPFIA